MNTNHIVVLNSRHGVRIYFTSFKTIAGLRNHNYVKYVKISQDYNVGFSCLVCFCFLFLYFLFWLLVL